MVSVSVWAAPLEIETAFDPATTEICAPFGEVSTVAGQLAV